MLFSQLICHHTQIKRLEGRPANNNPLSVGQQVHHRRRDWIQNFHAILSILTEGLSFSSQRIELPTMALHYLPNKTVTRGPSVTSRVTGCPVQSGGLVRRLRNLGHARELRSSCLVSYFGPSWKGFTLLPCAMCTRLSAFLLLPLCYCVPVGVGMNVSVFSVLLGEGLAVCIVVSLQ